MAFKDVLEFYMAHRLPCRHEYTDESTYELCVEDLHITSVQTVQSYEILISRDTIVEAQEQLLLNNNILCSCFATDGFTIKASTFFFYESCLEFVSLAVLDYLSTYLPGELSAMVITFLG